MKKIVYFLMLIMLIGCKVSNLEIKNAFSKHEISIMLLPDEQLFLAKDTLQIEYQGNTNELYFYLNSLLTVKKIEIGKQIIDFELVHTPIEFELPTKDSLLYKINLPTSLFPNSINIWYKGSYPIVREQLVFGNIQDNTMLLDGRNCWYPFTPNNKSVFTVKALTMDRDSTMTCNANLVCMEKNDLCLMSYWEQTEPISYLDFYLPGNEQ